MKNFSMPEHISPNLELDELMRLKCSLETIVSKEASDRIMSELPLTLNSTPAKRAEWVEKLSSLLENRFDGDIVKAIRQKCYCNENGAGWYIEGNQLYTKMFICECPMLEEAPLSQSLTWCHCTAGYSKKLFELVFETPVDVEILQSIRQGFDYCLVRVTFRKD